MPSIWPPTTWNWMICRKRCGRKRSEPPVRHLSTILLAPRAHLGQLLPLVERCKFRVKCEFLGNMRHAQYADGCCCLHSQDQLCDCRQRYGICDVCQSFFLWFFCFIFLSAYSLKNTIPTPRKVYQRSCSRVWGGTWGWNTCLTWSRIKSTDVGANLQLDENNFPMSM